MYEKLTTKTLVLYEIYFLYESRIFKYYFHTLYIIRKKYDPPLHSFCLERQKSIDFKPITKCNVKNIKSILFILNRIYLFFHITFF